MRAATRTVPTTPPLEAVAGLELMFAAPGDGFGDRLPERIRDAAAAGFTAVELWDWRTKDLAATGAALDETGLRLHTICAEGWAGKCQLADPDSHDEFIRRVRDTAQVAVELGAPGIVVLAGDHHGGGTVESERETVAAALARAARAIEDTGRTLLLEVVNRDDEAPDAVLDDTEKAMRVLELIDRPDVLMLYDRYHAVRNGERIGEALDGRIGRIGHVQVADIPGRHELGTGTVDWRAELAALFEAGYRGAVGLECVPVGDSAATLAAYERLVPPAARGRRGERRG